MPDSSSSPLPTPQLSAAAKAKIDAYVEETVASRKHPAIHVGATTADGRIYFKQAGERVFGEPEKGVVDEETRLQLFSMTKLITTVAILQLVERGEVDLDDAEQLAKRCPELAKLQVLEKMDGETPVLKDRTRPLTVRHLLTHTSGLAYEFTGGPVLTDYIKATGAPTHAANNVEGFCLPLLFEPGSSWRYSTGIDWAGIVVERASGKRLSDYFQDNIFTPLGLTSKDIGFFPTETVMSQLQQVVARTPGGLVHCPSPRSFDLAKVEDPAFQLQGGGGLFGTPNAYLRFLQGLLQSQRPGGILTPKSFQELFTDSLPPRDTPDQKVHAGMEAMSMLFGYADPDHVKNQCQHLGHSVGLLLNKEDSVHGRRAGSGCWSGLARTYYWLDPTTGIAAICFTQVLALPPDPFTDVYNGYERRLYDGLKESN